MVAEVVEGTLRPLADGEEYRQREALVALVLAIFDRYPVPAAIGENVWSKLRPSSSTTQLIGSSERQILHQSNYAVPRSAHRRPFQTRTAH